MKWTEEMDKTIAEMLCLSDNKSLGFKEAAKSLGVSVGSISSRYYRNRKAIDDCIIEWGYIQAYKTEKKPKKEETLWSKIKKKFCTWLHKL